MIRFLMRDELVDRTVFRIVDSPIGPLTILGYDEIVTSVRFARSGSPASPPRETGEDPRQLRRAVEQLDAYFRGDLTSFDLDLAPPGTAFQREVWTFLTTIPFGETRSYGEIARTLGRPDASRAVGAANGRNPIPIIVPCHRVVGSDGSLTGFGGGLESKRWLLDHESQPKLFS